MARARKKQVSFDAMVKFFMQHYGIPTTGDVEKLMERLDRLEKLIRQRQAAPRRKGAGKPPAGDLPGTGKPSDTYTDTVLQIIQSAGDPVGVADIQTRTGYDPKKIRNIIFRLGKSNKIKRVGRGVYAAA